MARILLLALLIINLTGCAHKLDNNWLYGLFSQGNGPATYNFDWQAKGEKSLLPLQVFDNGSQLWLQYQQAAALPAFFKRTPQGDILLTPKRSGEYLVFNQVPDVVLVRGGSLTAEITNNNKTVAAKANPGFSKLTPAPAITPAPESKSALAPESSLSFAAKSKPALVPEPIPTLATKSEPTLVPESKSTAAAKSIPTPVANTRTASVPDTALVKKSELAIGPDTSLDSNLDSMVKTKAKAKVKVKAKAAVKAKAFPVSNSLKTMPTVSPEYSVSPADINIRKALHAWSKRGNWTFNDEHWAVDVDIPIAGSASFGGNFQMAVRDLLAATELGDRPLQPCFYSNQVLRIVPYAQRCDRTLAIGAEL